MVEGPFAAGVMVGDIGHALEEGSGSAPRFGSEGWASESGGGRGPGALPPALVWHPCRMEGRWRGRPARNRFASFGRMTPGMSAFG